MKKMNYAKHRHTCDQMWMELFQEEVFDNIDPPERDIPDVLQDLNQAVAEEVADEIRSKADDDLLFLMRLAQMAIYELTVHGAGVLSFRRQRPTTDDKDDRMDINKNE